MQARFYSPILHRFLNEDPSGLNGGTNLYAYTNGDPIDFMDPFGLGRTETEIEGGNPGLHDDTLDLLADVVLIPKAVGSVVSKVASEVAPAIKNALGLGTTSIAASTTNAVTMAEGDAVLAVISDGKIIAQSSNMMLSHEAFVARTVGTLPEGAEVVTIGKYNGVVTAITSKTFSGVQVPASTAAQAASRAAFK